MGPIVKRDTAKHTSPITQSNSNKGSTKAASTMARKRPDDINAFSDRVSMLWASELERIFVPSGSHKSPEARGTVRIGMLDLSGEELDKLVDGEEVPSFLVDPSQTSLIPASEPFEIVPDTLSIAADHDVAAILPRDIWKLRDAVLGQILFQ